MDGLATGLKFPGAIGTQRRALDEGKAGSFELQCHLYPCGHAQEGRLHSREPSSVTQLIRVLSLLPPVTVTRRAIWIFSGKWKWS